jgi:hypothetical protein
MDRAGPVADHDLLGPGPRQQAGDADPATPAPETTMLTSSIRLPATFRALISPPRTMIAVPWCWLEKTGMSTAFSRWSAMVKARGAAMSSMQIAPKVGEMAMPASTTP